MSDFVGTDAFRGRSARAARPAAFHHVDVAIGIEFVDTSLATIRRAEEFSVVAQIPTRFFTRTYWWPGLEKDPVLKSGVDRFGNRHRLHGPVLRDGQHRTFVVDLGRELQPGDVETISFTQTLIDLDGAFDRHIGARVRHPMGSLELSAVLPKDMFAKVRGKQSPIGSDKILEHQALEPAKGPYSEVAPGFVAYKWTVADPQVDSHYRIDWNS